MELLLVAIVALVVLGPQQLSAIARRVGLWTRRWRALLASIQTEFGDFEKQQKLTENEARAQAAERLQKKSMDSNNHV